MLWWWWFLCHGVQWIFTLQGSDTVWRILIPDGLQSTIYFVLEFWSWFGALRCGWAWALSFCSWRWKWDMSFKNPDPHKFWTVCWTYALLLALQELWSAFYRSKCIFGFYGITLIFTSSLVLTGRIWNWGPLSFWWHWPSWAYVVSVVVFHGPCQSMKLPCQRGQRQRRRSLQIGTFQIAWTTLMILWLLRRSAES